MVLSAFLVTAAQTSPNVTKARGVTGQYRLTQNEFRNRLDVQQLPGGKIKLNLLALWVSPNSPENIHNGEIQAVVPLKNGVAVYESGNCRITMKFTPGKVVIGESGDNIDCGFGANVTAAGSYRRTSRKPKFDFQ